MDFKLAGTRAGLTALQLDVKLASGLSGDMLREALEKSRRARLRILDIMAEQVGLQSPPRPKPNRPVVEELVVPVSKRLKMTRMGGYALRCGFLLCFTSFSVFEMNQSLPPVFKENSNPTWAFKLARLTPRRSGFSRPTLTCCARPRRPSVACWRRRLTRPGIWNLVPSTVHRWMVCIYNIILYFITGKSYCTEFLFQFFVNIIKNFIAKCASLWRINGYVYFRIY